MKVHFRIGTVSVIIEDFGQGDGNKDHQVDYNEAGDRIIALPESDSLSV